MILSSGYVLYNGVETYQEIIGSNMRGDDTSNMSTSNIEYAIQIPDIMTSNMSTSNIEYVIEIPNEMTSNVLDTDGNPIYEYKLDESSNIVYDYEYEVKTVMYEGIEYKQAFVGCVYKCS